MLKQARWMSTADGLEIELQQCLDEGLQPADPDGLRAQMAVVGARDPADARREPEALELYREMESAPMRADYPYREPSDLESILVERSLSTPAAMPLLLNSTLNASWLHDRIHAAWLGRCAGCLLGQPVEGWRRTRIEGFLRDTENFPIRRYMSSAVAEPIRRRWEIVDKARVYGGSLRNWINNVEHAPEDDDTNYTVIALKLIEEYGMEFTPDDAAECWLMNLPILHVCTAERVAYRNLVNRIDPPASATFLNPYREWIGAQIRGDLFGWISPGDPVRAAGLAWRDASISHVKNGIYGEMWVAAMLAACPAVPAATFEDIIHAGMGQIPAASRLAAGLQKVLDWKHSGISARAAIQAVHESWDESNPHHWCHTISNAMIVALALLWGADDFGRVIGLAVEAGFDTDCNAATAGSIFGMLRGTSALPGAWTTPLKGRLKSGVDGFGLVDILEMAGRTARLAMAEIKN